MTVGAIRNLVNELRPVVVIVILIAAAGLAFSCSDAKNQADAYAEPAKYEPVENAININTATVGELEKIPHIGRKLAERVVAFRETYGPFRRPEQLLLVQE
jgi:competence ComEA-like helix-hairpin-helix protein